ncbi:hypothetical protein AALA52_10130 [Lactococcus ileimucosae]|uniref:Uncharacterized protein n=1 Tax=Lactococcus ileimucosae TaxID=2941329 RepID=A0ABV4D8C7_9LACT
MTQEEAKKLQAAAPTMQAQLETFLKDNPIQAREVMELQKRNPEEFAKLQVSKIKERLGFKE